ncbi:hypothetical protein [Tellurirhabdus rosea]|uniref:hypothetical protein n=1 Tax=Tellurirhabdus rosea TaxID=2674997 RepID=UPI00225972C9|nr:hypothetical protein [Tellurirhabdus rosea]
MLPRLLFLFLSLSLFSYTAPVARRSTTVSIVGEKFYINGQPTLKGRQWNGNRLEGLLPNSRMVQGIFDDQNPETRSQWAYPDTKTWDPERNTREFIAAMPAWKEHGMLAFTINLQGGSPQGYSKAQPWHNSAIEADGSLRPDYMARLKRILDRADELGMVVILGYFYFGQDERLKDEAAVVRATDLATDWIHRQGYRHVMVEITNECNIRYDHPILQPERVHELIRRVHERSRKNGRRLLVSTSYGGNTVPQENVVRESDYILLHGNSIKDPNRITAFIAETRAVPGYRPMPIVINEDDHFDFDKPLNNFVAATKSYVSWGFFDFRMKDEGYNDGYQSVPVNWQISSPRKKAFFDLLKEMTGGNVLSRR